jgi:sulfur relay (sulfurtransferase) DsrC/TusE family protein
MPGSDQDDLKSLILVSSENVKTLQAAVKGNAQAIQRLEKQPPASSSTSSDGIPKQTHEHHNDRLPRF